MKVIGLPFNVRCPAYLNQFNWQRLQWKTASIGKRPKIKRHRLYQHLIEINEAEMQKKTHSNNIKKMQRRKKNNIVHIDANK